MGKSPLMSGIAIANSMIGSSMILFPVTFNQGGILINVLFVVPLPPLSSSWQPSWPSPANS
jgi:amino acid permease